MIVPPSNKGPDIMFAKLMWLALTASIIFYGTVLFSLGRIHTLEIPYGELSLIEVFALGVSLLVVPSFMTHRYQSKKNKFDERFRLMFTSWALNETIALIGMMGTYSSMKGNAFYFIVNGIVAITANILMFPKL